VLKPLGIYSEFAFYSHYSFGFHYRLFNRQFRKIRKLGKLFVVVIGVFLHTVLVSAILTIIGVCFFRFIKISSFQNAIEMHEGASGGSQITNYLLLTIFYEFLLHVGINYIFFSNRLCQSTSGEKGKVLGLF
jgi:hypothetical protein